ncbi:SLAP domain-containing protein [Lactobacillus sp. ESL0225]|uniref:SLAP domain-containing protein n=1 Tax=Lactobacillus sp. ESL0225 TaxID=2069351 RepID=UPI000EFD0431|nr:SLAP domain-containing protein [Lactobacillus sp. ESL0225]RMC48171.1 hypothetical protein F5ESL0225_07610 [Lactobacillus sp. ESL0225]
MNSRKKLATMVCGIALTCFGISANNQVTPVHAAVSSTPSAGNDTSTPGVSNGTSTPGAGNDTSTPDAGNDTSTPGELPTPKIGLKLYLNRASYQYTKAGKRVPKSKLSKKKTVMSNGKVYTIKGKKYYCIGHNRYIKAVNVLPYSKKHDELLKLYLNRASYQYTKTGKRVLKSLLSKKKTVMSNREVYTIKGKKYYRIGHNRYIKVANVVTPY